jgi:hypothetical protein
MLTRQVRKAGSDGVEVAHKHTWPPGFPTVSFGKGVFHNTPPLVNIAT